MKITQINIPLNKKIAILIASATLFSATILRSDFFEIAKQIEIFTTLFKALNMNYVDETNPADLMDNAIRSMLDGLDPYTQFYNEQDIETSRINLTVNYTGVGANLRILKDKLVVVEAYKNYPADKAGLKAGDEIIKVDDVDVANFKDDANNLLQGAPGSSISITYKRQGKTNTISLTRSAMDIKSVPFYTMLDDKTGYIVLSEFDDKASNNVYAALKALKNKGASQLVLDLRGNPGGLLNEAVNITNLFVPKDALVVTTKSKIKKHNRTYFTQREIREANMPIVVLINDKSASASEIVSGALQDLDRAVIIGARSFGKGLVQVPLPLSYGTQMKVTISRYYTPSGRCIQALDYWNRDEEGKATRIKQKDYNAFKTQGGRTVYDGGGVHPDIEIKSTKTSAIVKAIEAENLIFDFATNYYYKYKVEDSDNFRFSDKDFEEFKTFLLNAGFNFETQTEKTLKKASVIAEDEALSSTINKDYNNLMKTIATYKTNAIDKNKTILKTLLTDEIIKRYFYSEGLYEYHTKHSEAIKEALAVLNNPKRYRAILKP